MIRWLYIDSEPPLQIHDAAGQQFVDPAVRAEQILESFSAFRSDVEGEVPNVVATLRNADGEATAALVDPPIAARAIIFGRVGDDSVELFAGVIASVSLAADGGSIEVSA